MDNDLLQLCKRFASELTQIQSLYWEIMALPEEEQAEAWCMKFPILQGTRNQMALRKFGEDFDEDAAHRAFLKEVHQIEP
tara:strand:+ start:4167 stop:4406 length:240 start_codon:yes stop_codon:yes gene_type:complete